MLRRRILFPVAAATVGRLQSSSPPSSGDNKSSTGSSGSSGYDRAAELKREEEARQNLQANGIPNPFKQHAQQTTRAAGQPQSLREAWDEAWNQSSKMVFGGEKPPGSFNEMMTQARERAQKMAGTKAPGAASDQPQQQPSTAATATPGASSTDATTNTASPGMPQMPPNPFAAWGSNPAGAGAAAGAGRPPNAGRLFAGLIIVYCSFWMMRRQGMFGNFEHISIPYWVNGYEDVAKWYLFLMNLEEPRRLEIESNFYAAKQAYPSLSFFDYVDSVQPDWCSSPSYSKQDVVAAVTSIVRSQNQYYAMATIRHGLDAGDRGSWFGSQSDTGLSRNQKRIDAMMKALPPAASAGGFGAAFRPQMSPMMYARPINQDGSNPGSWSQVPVHPHGQVPQAGGFGWIPASGGHQQLPPMSAFGGYGQQQQSHQGWQQPQQQPQYGAAQPQYSSAYGHPQGHGTQPHWGPPSQGHGQQYQQYPQTPVQYGQQQQQHQQWPPQANGTATDAPAPTADRTPATSSAGTNGTDKSSA